MSWTCTSCSRVYASPMSGCKREPDGARPGSVSGATPGGGARNALLVDRRPPRWEGDNERLSPSAPTALDKLQHPDPVALRLYLLPDITDLAVGPDEKRRARRAHIVPAVYVLLPPHAVALRDGAFFVGEQGERQLKLADELLVRAHAVGADAQHLRPLRAQLPPGAAEATGFGDTARRTGLREEVQDNGPPTQVRQGERVALGVGQRKVWRHLAGLQDGASAGYGHGS